VAGNAFYCSNGDFVAYDEQGLLPKLREQFGEFAVGLVFAHELGHAVQARVGYNPSATVYLEQQADCFAGAWAQHVADSDDENVHLSTDDLDNALAGLLTLSDPSGVDGGQDGAHGNGFDRVNAFQDGYEGGAQTCAAYESNPPDVTEAGYTSYSDQASDGNLPLDELLPTITDSLGEYWSSQSSKLTAPTVNAGSVATGDNSDGGVLTDAVTYDGSTNAITYDATTMQKVHDNIGDFGSGMLVASAWASSVQHQLGTTIGDDGARRGAECLAGAWTASLSSKLSPGDLDEAVTVLVAAGKGSTDRGTAFDRVAAFRAGFKHGPSKCVQSS
jgi:predicted metalloprotease